MKISQLIIDCFDTNNGTITVSTLRGKEHTFFISKDKKYIYSETALGSQKLYLSCFDVVVDFLRENDGFAPKGCGHSKDDKVGYGKCSLDTVCGCIATRYFGKKIGESTFDPVFAVSAVLEYAGICKNGYGVLKLNQRYY